MKIVANAPGISPPGPDFLAEVARTNSEPEPNFSERAQQFVDDARAGALFVQFDANWHKQTRSKTAGQQKTALNKAVKFLKQEYETKQSAVIAAKLTDLYTASIYDTGFSLPVRLGSKFVMAHFVPGTVLGNQELRGPRPSSVMVIGKHPGQEEIKSYKNLSGKASEPLWRAVDELGIRQLTNTWYATNMLKHQALKPGSEVIAKSWIDNCLPLLHIELRIVRPDFILCFGGDAVKAVLNKKISVTDARNQIFELEIPAHDDQPVKIAKLMVIPHPASVFHNPPSYNDFREALAGFIRVLHGGVPRRQRITKRHHVSLYKERTLRHVVDEIVARSDGNVVALDAEWHGNWWEPDAWLRTIQFSPRAGEAYCVVLRKAGGAPAFHPSPEAALPQLERLCRSTATRDVRVGGHFFRADLPWLIRYGWDLRQQWQAPLTPEDTKYRGGWDTADMLHALYESEKSFGLKLWATKLLGTPQYSKVLDAYITELTKGKRKKDLGGFGDIPDEILLPYAAWDASITRELFDVLNGEGDSPGLLDRDSLGINSRAAFWLNISSSPAFLEMEMNGLTIDRDRIDALSIAFLQARAELISKLREEIKWPEFNVNSPDQVKEFLFGEQYNGRHNPKTGESIQLRPEGAISLGLEPLMSTSNKEWSLIDEEELELYNPSTDKQTLGILGQEAPLINRLLDVKVVAQVIKNPLHAPLKDEDGKLIKNGKYLTYDGGIVTALSADGKLRASFRNLETGRCSTRPNCQAFSKRRDPDYRRLLGANYPFPLRSIITAPPGHVLIESDYKSAELAVLAWMSNDENMLDAVQYSLLDESDPRYRNMHATNTVKWFKLDCEPNKAAIKAAGKEALYVGSKNVVFGLNYGRGARAILRQCLSEGVDITLPEVEQMFKQYHASHPSAMGLIHSASARVMEPGYLIGALGRPRRFGYSADRSIIASMQREAGNVIIQGAVGDTMRLAMRKLYEFKQSLKGPETFDLLMNIHDALLFAVPIPHIDWFLEILPKYMCDEVPFYPTDLDGVRIPGLGPYRFSVETEMYVHWGEKITPEVGAEAGIPEKYWSKKK